MGDGGAGGDGGETGVTGLGFGEFGELGFGEAEATGELGTGPSGGYGPEGFAEGAPGFQGEGFGSLPSQRGDVSTPSVSAPADIGGGVDISKPEKPEEKPEEKVEDIKKPKVITRAKRRRSLFTEEEPTVYRRSLLGR